MRHNLNGAHSPFILVFLIPLFFIIQVIEYLISRIEHLMLDVV